MIRLAALALAAALLPIPASAGCRTAPEIVTSLKAVYPTTAFVAEIPASLVPTIIAWLAAEGLPHRADRIVQVVGDRGLGLVLVAGDVDWDCDGTVGVELLGSKATELVALVRRFHEMRGWGPERSA
ncbi:hypothetical protein [Methylobacterium sp. J-077]|uniref:hypothetical protein n=1 Tax=Methylobacterium sp. J-077 TaxID=2836656 RepID=UPI001FB923A7|nr:hypothetical protein [Methylobacterium sp. J-077]MCJ2124913.1 hypothetical protein [Methylobacterium sp. J-077]